MTLKVTTDPGVLNHIVNLPDVRPWFGGCGALDLTSIISDGRHVSLEKEHGGFIALWCDLGLYDCHFLYPLETDGAEGCAIIALRRTDDP
jgi:hypothetical protein